MFLYCTAEKDLGGINIYFIVMKLDERILPFSL